MFGEILFIDIIIGCLIFLFTFYIYNSFKHSYWRRRNVSGPRPVPIFGNMMKPILGKVSVHERFRELYLTWKHEPFIGIYVLMNPCLLINDPILIKQIWIKDFNVFSNRGFPVNEDVDPLSANLLELDGYLWKQLRHKLTPLFTPGKLKQMYHLINECADIFEKYIGELFANEEPVEVRDVTAKFTMDVIGSCAFGLNLKALSREESEFRNIGRKMSGFRFISFVKHFLKNVLPGIFKLLKISIVSRKNTKFFMGSIAATIADRKKSGVVRNDFIDSMIQLQENPDKIDFELTDEMIAAQAFIFFTAGFETSSITMSYALYELALNQEIQDKLRFEIRAALKTNDGKLSYENIKELKYLDKVFKETLRKNPPAATLPRAAVEDYVIPGTDVKIPAGVRVFISVLGLHHDPQYYPNPEIFDPERFSEEAIRQRPQMVYLPFGEGPRNCIGGLFASFQAKTGLLKILKDYRVTISPKTEVPFRMSNYPVVCMPLNGIYLNFTKIP